MHGKVLLKQTDESIMSTAPFQVAHVTPVGCAAWGTSQVYVQGTMDADAAETGANGVPAKSELGEHDQCLLQCLIEQLLVTTHGV